MRQVWRDFLDAAKKNGSPINDKHLRLLELIAEDIGYKKICWEDIKQFYYPKGLAEKHQDEEVLRRAQVDMALSYSAKEND